LVVIRKSGCPVVGRKFAPLADRMTAYREVRMLVDAGFPPSPSKISARLEDVGCPVPTRETIRRWAVGATSPFSGKRLFTPNPSEELSFFLGAWLGDGWADQNDGGKRMRLKVRSKSFAERFAAAAGSILQRESYGIWTTVDNRGPWYNVKVTSCMLYDFVNEDLSELKSYLESFPKGFLSGFFTAEGNPSISVSRRGPRLDIALDLSNSDLELLQLCRDLLANLGFSPSRIRLVQQAGESTNLGTATKPGWLLMLLSLEDVRRFAETIGFADLTKQAKLTDALELVRRLGPRNAAEEWTERYVKLNKKWVAKVGSEPVV